MKPQAEPPKYLPAWIKAEVEVEAYENPELIPESALARGHARRTVTLSLRESFADDAGMDAAIDAFAASIREAARR